MNIKIGLYALIAPLWLVSSALQFKAGNPGISIMYACLGLALLVMGISKDKTQK